MLLALKVTTGAVTGCFVKIPDKQFLLCVEADSDTPRLLATGIRVDERTGVPIAPTLMLLVIGVAGLGWSRRRK